MTETIGAGGSGAYPTKEHAIQAAADRIGKKETHAMTEEQRDLIAKIEAATEPDMELDAEIATASGWQMYDDGCWDLPGQYDTALTGTPPFTSSIDRAMLLVPKGHWWAIVMRGNEDGFDASVIPPDTEMTWHRGANAALAICIAALKARFV